MGNKAPKGDVEEVIVEGEKIVVGKKISEDNIVIKDNVEKFPVVIGIKISDPKSVYGNSSAPLIKFG